MLRQLQVRAWELFQQRFQGKEFEQPCTLLLRALYGDESVEVTSGRSEHGADAICRFTDPLGVENQVVVQIKMWDLEADRTRPLDQIRDAYVTYQGTTAGVVLSTSNDMTPRFVEELERLKNDLRIPIRVILREELMRLFIRYLPELVPDKEPESNS
jgi:hypothetical protein